MLLSHEASVNVQDQKGSTPLHLAAWAGHTDVVDILLDQGPSVPIVNHQVSYQGCIYQIFIVNQLSSPHC